MIVVDKNNRSPRYLINENAISFTENYQGVNQKGNPIYDVVSVSIVSNAAIMVYDDNNGIGYGNDLQYQRWHLSGATTGLVSAEAHNIYARLSRGEKKEADVIFSVRNYNTDGSITKRNEDGDPVKDEEGNDVYELEASDTYYYILIGTLTALTDVNAAPNRTLTFDPGYLSSQKSNNEQAGGWIAEMFDLVRGTEKLIRAKLRFEDIRVKGEAIFASFVSFYSGLKIGSSDSAKTISSVATDLTSKEDESEAIATPAYVKAFSEPRYLRYDIEDDQTVNGTVNFKKNLSVAGEHSVGGSQSISGTQSVVGSQTIGRNQTIGGSQEVKGLQTLHGGLVTNNFSDVGGQITGAQLTQAGVFSVAGLKAMSFEVFELIYNNIRAVDGKLSLSSTGVIEHCEIVLLGSGLTITPEDFYAEESDYTVDDIDYLWLTFKEDDFNKGLLQFTHNDILYGYVNQIGESGQYARGGQSCMYVLSTNEEIADANAEKNGQRKMTIKVKLFADDITDENGNLIYDNQNQVVGNMSPTIGMSLAHRGNINGNYPERMTSFFIDSQSGNIVMLQNVMTPQINKGHYGGIVGKLPTDLYNEVVKIYPFIKPYDPVSYAKYGIFENLLQFDHQGQPIQRENNRGEWVEPVYDEDGNQLNPYKNMPTYYDTVTYRGSLYKCVESDTFDVPGQGDGWLLLVAKGDADVYLLKANPTSIYVRKDNTASVDYANVTVGHSTSNGYVVIDSDAKLAEKKMSVYYSTDKDTTKKKVSLGAAVKLIITDSGVVITTDAGTPLSTDGDKIYVSPDDDHVIIYLIEDETSIEVDTLFIPVVREGQDGTSIKVTGSYATVADFEAAWKSGDTWIAPENTSDCYVVVSDLYVWVPKDAIWKNVGQFKGDKGADGKDGKDGVAYDPRQLLVNTSQFDANWTLGTIGVHMATIVDGLDGHKALYIVGRRNFQPVAVQYINLTGGEWYTLSFLAKHNGTSSSRLGKVIGDGIIDTTQDIYVDGVVSNTEDLSDVSYTSEWNLHTYTFRTKSTLPTEQTISLYIKDQSPTQMYLCQPKLEKGKEATSWAASKEDFVGPAGEAGPMLYPAGEWVEGATYKKDGNAVPYVYYDVNPDDEIDGTYYILKVDSIYSTTPPSDDLTNWRPMTAFEAIYTKFLMANWAKFGSDKGGIFYDRYLFSQYGHNNIKYSQVSKDEIFEEDGDFKNWLPKLHLDFWSGLANISCLCEPYNTPIVNDGVMQIDMDGGFNVKIPFPDIDILNYIPYPLMPLVILPNFKNVAEWAKNGSHVTIMFESGGGDYGQFVDSNNASNPFLKSLFVLVCVDNPVTSGGISSPSFMWNSGGDYIIHKGRRAKYVILGVGATIKLKATEKDGNTYWYVENEGSVTEEKVDIYSSIYGAEINQMPALTIRSSNYNRVQFYGADYSTLVNLKQDYHGESIGTRGLMLYSGPEGLCPRNIVFSHGNSVYGHNHYRIVSVDEIYASDFTSIQGPLLAD